MGAGLLESKTHPPRLRRGFVARPRLAQQLDLAEAALTLLSAPAGFGKTTLLMEWLSAPVADTRSLAWLSLDQGDNDPVTFWRYLVASVAAAEPGVGAKADALLQSYPAPMEEVVAALLNDVSTLSHEVVVVLDDYHVIEERAIHEQMIFLLTHLPSQLRLVIASRTDPPLPLARLRARGDLVEIRAADLRFRPDEAATYLTDVMGLDLAARDVSALESRTEGWIAALQLAALSLQGRDDASGFIASFAGDDRYIVDYLAEEVLQHLPGRVRELLLQTSILERLCGALCDAVTGRDDSAAELAALERANLFLVPLDDKRHWYRYHQLFADVLQVHLYQQHPADVAELHSRASRWFEENNSPREAISHALTAGDFDRAARLVELAIPGTRTSRQETVLLGWLASLPDEAIRARPVLSVGYAGTLLVLGETDGVEAHLLDAERWLMANRAEKKPDDNAAMGGDVDSEEFRRLPASIEMHRAGLALVLGNPLGAVTHARQALGVAAVDDDVNRGGASALVGLAAWGGGDLEAARRAYIDSIAHLRRAGHLSDSVGCAIALADISQAQGNLGAALHTYEQGLRDAMPSEGVTLRGAADMHVGLSDIHRERGDLAAATQDLLRSQLLGEHLGLPQNRYRWSVAMARIRQAEGDLDGALDLLDEADRFYVGDFSPNVRPVPAMRARLRIARREWGEALGWVRDSDLTVHDELSYLREFEHVTLARILLGRHTAEPAGDCLTDAMGLLTRLLPAAEVGGRGGSVIEVSMLQSLAHQAAGDTTAALAALERALMMAEPQGYVRTFVDEGQPMASLLRTATKRGVTPGYARLLLARLNQTMRHGPAPRGLVESLSERELVILRLLGSDLDGPGIARELSVSLTTVRTHIQHIYTKLDVNNRRAAVTRARNLDLLPRTHIA